MLKNIIILVFTILTSSKVFCLEQKTENNLSEDILKLIKIQNSWSNSQRQANEEASNDLFLKAKNQVSNKNFDLALKNFFQAFKKNPQNTIILFEISLTYYQLAQYQKSLDYMNEANDPQIPVDEKKFYRALINLKLNNYDNSLDDLDSVHSSSQTDLKEASYFYSGYIYFQKQNFEKAKSDLTIALNSTSVPELAKEAEILLLKIYHPEENSSVKWLHTFEIGELYDSNILNLAANTASNIDGYRSYFQYSNQINLSQRYSIQSSVLDFYSTDTQFQYKSSYHALDPLIYNFYLPITLNPAASKFDYNYKVSPGYENIHMDLYSTGGSPSIVDSYILRGEAFKLIDSKTQKSFKYELRRDITSIISDSMNNYSGYKNSLYASLTKKTQADRIWNYQVNTIINNAEGHNQLYYQVSGEVNNIRDFYLNTQLFTKISAYYQYYPSQINSRQDTDFLLAFAIKKNLSSNSSMNLGYTYTNNLSTDSSYAYSKNMISFSLNLSIGN